MLTLRPVFSIAADVAPAIEVGATPLGERRLIPILGGRVSGPRLTGKILPGGTDYQSIRDEGLADIHARYVIETETGSRVYVENSGIRRGPSELIARLKRGEPVDPALIYFRTVPRFETGDPDLAWLMRSIFVCAGARLPDQVLLDIYEVG
ncbi:MAG: DUF3237 domain-containing protein [Phreatobacter sp.]|uniref:DUF3237 domain-containing protein n=1 Tax=Phreatobacter sp. TaxID=1966341 RepID=UPI001A55C682|nr:DUF3237 domain-containing protein [Phreatobacter sp.]MBL8568002.1 DUF3237 domain-containing protein [Phreatobacter sp.]